MAVPYEIRTAAAAFFIGTLISWPLVVPSTARRRFFQRLLLFTGSHTRWWAPFAIAALSLASNYFIEKPALQWKDKLEGTRHPDSERELRIAVA